MRVTKEKAYRSTFVAEYESVSDFAFALANRKYANHVDTSWAGGTPNEVVKYCKHGNEAWARRAESMVDKIANVAVTNLGMDLDYNLVHGVIDYGAMTAGNPECMYGTTITENRQSADRGLHRQLD